MRRRACAFAILCASVALLPAAARADERYAAIEAAKIAKPKVWRKARKARHWRAAKRKVRRVVARPAITIPLPRPAPTSFDRAWDRIALQANPARAVPSAVRPAPITPADRAGIFARYEASLLRPAGNCREWETVDARVKRVVSDAAAHFGGTARLTSCYRSIAHNRRVGGARHSQHIRRKALDFVVVAAGRYVDKDALANWVRRHQIMRRIGGVGRYRTAAIHVDVGPKRNWDWRRKPRTRYAGLQ